MLNDDVADSSTIEISSNNLSVLKVPNALTAGDGIDAGGTFDGLTLEPYLFQQLKLLLHLSNTIHL